MSDGNIITLDVGGQMFRTLESTLRKSEYFTAKLEHWTNKDECIFVDGDPEAFRHVLNFLRNPNYKVPEQYEYELDYYSIKYSADNLLHVKKSDKSKKICDTIHALNQTVDSLNKTVHNIFASFTNYGKLSIGVYRPDSFGYREEYEIKKK